MEFKGIRVLLLEGYARQSLPLIRAFKKLGCTVSVLCNSKLDVAYASRYPDEKILGICNPEDYKNSEEYIVQMIKTKKFDLVVPLVDFSAKILSENKEELEKFSKIASNSRSVYLKAQDKLEVMRVCAENGIPCPKTIFNAENINDVINAQISFPFVAKPRTECGAKGFAIINNSDEFEEYFKKNEISKSVIQEYVKQNDSNLSANIFVDDSGNIKSFFTYRSVRWFPLNGGTGTFNQLVHRADVEMYCRKLVKLFDLRGAVGIDMIDDLDEGIPKIIEINPRTTACIRIGFEAGINLAQQMLELELGKSVTEYEANKTNLYVRMLQTDLLWFLKSKDRFKRKPSWFNIKNTKEQLFYIDDPLPWFAFSLQGLFRVKKEMKKRS